MDSNKKITLQEKDIEYLFNYTDRHQIKFKDVQIELVDHLATGVESKMAKNPELTFNRALYDYTGTLPINFFNQVIEEKTKSLKKYWQTKFAKYIISFFTLPKVVITFLLYFIIFNLVTTYKSYTYTIGFSYLAFIFIGLIFLLHTKEKLKNQLNNFLCVKAFSIANELFYTIFFAIPFWSIFIIDIDLLSSKLGIIFLSISTTSMILYIYAYRFHFIKMLNQDIQQKYAHLKIKLI